ncbi:TIGR02391 family protein, partial [Bacteroides acidifaciens]
MELHILTPVVVECIANILGDTSEGLTGSEIHKCLLQSGIEDVDPTNTKRFRLYNAFAKACNESKCSNCVFTFISVALAPERFVSEKERFESLRDKINQQLAFCGYKYNEDGKFSKTPKASRITDVEIKAKNLKIEVEKRKAHSEILNYCKAELLQNNYFHAVFEANKGLFQRI